MTARRVLSSLLLAGATLSLLALAGWSLAGVVQQLPRVRTAGQWIETLAQTALGVLSVGVVLTVWLARAWSGAIRRAWAASFALVAGLSALVWGPPMLLPALAFTAGALAVAWLLGWALRVATRAAPPRETLVGPAA
ncbi:MAG TPA: hypothetical protein VEA99_08470 [Gemmatimonadaceae bacterium]|nr:hypothetical protein [Gemmatimonadaceae bacterium]